MPSFAAPIARARRGNAAGFFCIFVPPLWTRPHTLPLDLREDILHWTAAHRGARGDHAGVVIRSVEDEIAGHLHVDLPGALQPPLEPLRRKLVFDALADRIHSTTDRA